MPANPKYLTASPGRKAVKVSAAILGSYLVTVSLHTALACWFDPKIILITTAFTGFILWVVLMIVAFLARSGWKVWGIYLILSSVFGMFAYLGQFVSHG